MAIFLTQSAADRVHSFLASRGHGLGLRLAVRTDVTQGLRHLTG